MRRRLHRVGIAAEPQARIDDIAVADLRVGRTLLLELDGRSTHDFDTDRAREETAIRGFATLRFSSTGILQNWARCELAVRRCIELGLHELC
ncbi:hypothetical protein HQQ80_13535 [Microbacteriaceae bacterium VKM Ac-2855]|nr:hypothetical protein [Microbacteriaceae bacterium VKM Ac-2855]